MIRYSGLGHSVLVASLKQKIAAEIKMRELIDEEGLPPPDSVEYGYTCIRLFWHQSKTVVVIDIDEPPPGWEYAGADDGSISDEPP